MLKFVVPEWDDAAAPAPRADASAFKVVEAGDGQEAEAVVAQGKRRKREKQRERRAKARALSKAGDGSATPETPRGGGGGGNSDDDGGDDEGDDAPLPSAEERAEMAREKKRERRRQKRARERERAAAAAGDGDGDDDEQEAPQKRAKAEEEPRGGDGKKPKADKQAALRAKLDGARFRWLNEQLYTRPSPEAVALYKEDRGMFDLYHQGYREQVAMWPMNPLDEFIAHVRRHPKWVVADLGCGEARLSASVPNKVHSFDLVAANDRVVACDIANVPLPDGAVDAVVICLALMGTNFLDFVTEARRILRKSKKGGRLMIAEVTSRCLDMPAFIAAVEAIGFEKVHQEVLSKMFVRLDFVLAAPKPGARSSAPPETKLLKPCLYKRR